MVEFLLDKPIFQLFAIILIIVLVAFVASLVTFNFRKSLSFLISVDTFAGSSEELDRRGFTMVNPLRSSSSDDPAKVSTEIRKLRLLRKLNVTKLATNATNTIISMMAKS